MLVIRKQILRKVWGLDGDLKAHYRNHRLHCLMRVFLTVMLWFDS